MQDILVVDDAPDAAEALASLMNTMGYGTRIVHDGQAALEAVRAAKPLCVLLDIDMPGMDGAELASRLRQECGDDVILIAITGIKDESDPRLIKTFALVDHHYLKPFDPAELENLLGH